MILYMFLAASTKDGKPTIVLTDSVVPGKVDLFAFIRDFSLRADIGRYRRLDLDPDSPTVGFHLFEHGIVRLSPVYI